MSCKHTYLRLNLLPFAELAGFKDWLPMKSRNTMTDTRRISLFVARVPQASKEMDFMREWIVPHLDEAPTTQLSSLDTELFVEYFRAFYHGMDLRILPNKFSWTSWDKSIYPNRRANLPKHVGLTDSNQSTTRIRVRSVAHKSITAQLNLNGILDTAISILPADAYALRLLVDHDIYENDDDDFCCGVRMEEAALLRFKQRATTRYLT
ncbi:hypothetical protein BU25DRAFT_435123 [Macroventuria anomochaeta]|uniref:Uncharacterized protein n=1 Tax=Macroventuria anomochaeta TaxID=301207 RepID=A0ACB6RJP8_9PLEO|nr:uncharacterized protein BU25DRAFT_435123 [Macroventuria anomochaeta]KAF2622053.1 hypothetical protein BU25DRAFT_435123 [Macroventuria anomochaeta]